MILKFKDEMMRSTLISKEKYEKDKSAELRYAEEKGRIEERYIIAFKLLAEGLNIDMISEVTGLSKNEILKLNN